MVYLKNEDLKDLIKEGNVLVDFFATWCGPCKMLGPELEELANERSDFKIIKVDIDEHQDLARIYGIMSVPTLLYFKNGSLVKQQSGFVPKDVIISNFKNM